MYETHENPDVLQREWLEAQQAADIAASTLERANTEQRNASDQYDAAVDKAKDYQERYLAALSASRGEAHDPSPSDPATSQEGSPASTTPDQPAVVLPPV